MAIQIPDPVCKIGLKNTIPFLLPLAFDCSNPAKKPKFMPAKTRKAKLKRGGYFECVS